MKLLQPYGFDVGESERGNVLKGLDLGVQGMRVGGQVKADSTSWSLCFVTNFILIWTISKTKCVNPFFQFDLRSLSATTQKTTEQHIEIETTLNFYPL